VHVSYFSSSAAAAADSTSIQLTTARSCFTNNDRVTGELILNSPLQSCDNEEKEQRDKQLLFVIIVIINLFFFKSAALSLSVLKK
jgi:hypothetical protein